MRIKKLPVAAGIPGFLPFQVFGGKMVLDVRGSGIFHPPLNTSKVVMLPMIVAALAAAAWAIKNSVERVLYGSIESADGTEVCFQSNEEARVFADIVKPKTQEKEQAKRRGGRRGKSEGHYEGD